MEKLPKDYKDRMEGLVNTNVLKDCSIKVSFLTREWLDEGFDKEDIKKYFAEIIDKIPD